MEERFKFFESLFDKYFLMLDPKGNDMEEEEEKKWEMESEEEEETRRPAIEASFYKAKLCLGFVIRHNMNNMKDLRRKLMREAFKYAKKGDDKMEDWAQAHQEELEAIKKSKYNKIKVKNNLFLSRHKLVRVLLEFKGLGIILKKLNEQPVSFEKENKELKEKFERLKNIHENQENTIAFAKEKLQVEWFQKKIEQQKNILIMLLSHQGNLFHQLLRKGARNARGLVE